MQHNLNSKVSSQRILETVTSNNSNIPGLKNMMSVVVYLSQAVKVFGESPKLTLSKWYIIPFLLINSCFLCSSEIYPVVHLRIDPGIISTFKLP